MARTIRVELDLEASTFSAKMKDATGKFVDLEHAIEKASGEMDVSSRKTKSLLKDVRDLTLILSQARSAFYNLRLFLVGWLDPIVKVNAEIQRAAFLLEGMSTQLTEVGRRNEAQRSLEYLIETAKSSPFALNALTDSFVKMKSTGMDPTAGSMKSLIDAVARFGGDSNILHRASIAIQQMAGKGVISMEELRQQLGEAVPNAVRMMARSMNLTYRELVDKISKGQVEASAALEKMFGEFDRTFGGSASRMVDTFGGAVQRAKTVLMEFALQIGGFRDGKFADGSFMKELTGIVNDFVDFLQTADAAKFASDLGGGIKTVIRFLADMAKWLAENWRLVEAAGKAFLISFGSKILIDALTRMFSTIGGLNGALKTLTSGLSQAATGAKIMANASAAGNMSAISWSVGLKTATNGLMAFGKSLLSIAPTAAVAIGVIFSIADAFGIFENKAYNAKKAWEDFQKGITTEGNIKAVQERLAQLTSQLETAKREASSTTYSYGEGFVQKDSTDILRDKENVKRLEAEILETKNRLSQMIADFGADLGDQQARATIRRFESSLGDMNAQFEAASAAIEEKRKKVEADTTLSVKERNDKVKALNEENLGNVNKYYVDLFRAANKQGQLLRDEADALKGLSTTEAMAARARVKEWDLYMEDLRKRARDAVATAESPNNFLAPSKKQIEHIDPIVRKIATIQGNIAKLKEGINSTKAPVAEFLAEVKAGMYPNITDAQKSLIEKLLEQEAQLERRKDLAPKFTALYEEIARSSQDAKAALGSLFQGDLEKSDTATENFRQRLEKLVGNIEGVDEATRKMLASLVEYGTAQFSITQQVSVLDKMVEKTREINESAMGVNELREANHNRELARVMRLIDINKFEGEDKVRVLKIVSDYQEALGREEEAARQGALRRQMDGWKDLATNIQQATVGWVDGFIDALAEGELSFGDFARGVLKELAKIVIRATIANAVMAAFGASSGTPNIDASAAAYPGYFHSGGTVGLNKSFGKVDPSVFLGARRMHTGGIAGLKPDEEAAILRKGERVSTPQQWKQATSGMGQERDVQVNLINQSGQPLNGEKAGVRFDGQQMIIDVVINALNKPGKMRETVKGLR